jgi:hypothetical protein
MISISVPGLASIILSTFLKFIYIDILHTDFWLTTYLFPDDSYEIDDDG